MSRQYYDEMKGSSAPENYERYFVPSIGAPVAEDLMLQAALRPGERVLDVACGTGTVTRMAARKVTDTGSVAGLDVNPGMLAVARSNTPSDTAIEWYEAPAEDMPLAGESFDVVLCQMGLQFMEDKIAALREMRRVLAAGGRVVLNVPGPASKPFKRFADALNRIMGPKAAGFVTMVFSLNDISEIQRLFGEADFRDVDVRANIMTLQLPKPKDFLWQYVHSTPLADLVEQLDEGSRRSLEEEIANEWGEFTDEDGNMVAAQRLVTARATR